MIKIRGALFVLVLLCNSLAGCRNSKIINEYFDKPTDREIVKAAFQGDAVKLEALLKDKKSYVDCRGKQDTTPLMAAVIACNKRAISLLLQKGADPNLQDVNGYTPTNLAARSSNPWFLETMLKYHGNPNGTNNRGETPVFEAISQFSIKNIDILFKAGANLDVQNIGGTTPMIYAANLNRFDIVYHLLELGADPTLTDIHHNSVTYPIQDNSIDPNSPLAKDRDKVIDWLKKRNIWKENNESMKLMGK